MNATPFSFTWVPVFGILFPIFLLAVIFGFVVLMRYLRYRENLLLAERGLPPVDRRDLRYTPSYRANPYRQLRSGVITSFVGLALLVGLWTLGTGPWLIGGLVPLAVGLGELLTFVITSPTRPRDGGYSDGNDMNPNDTNNPNNQ